MLHLGLDIIICFEINILIALAMYFVAYTVYILQVSRPGILYLLHTV